MSDVELGARDRVLLDTSIFNVIESSTATDREQILRLLDPAAREVRMTWETIQEIVSVAGTRKGSRLANRCRILRALVQRPPYLAFPSVVRAELAGESVFFSNDDHQRLQIVLERLAGGGAPAKTLRELHLILGMKKRDHFEGYQRIQATIRRRRHGRPSLERSTTFEEFKTEYWKQRRGRFDAVPGANSIAVPLPTALERPDQYPYSHAFLRADAALLYRHLIQNRRVDRGDVFDAASLVCLAGMDTLITEDRGLRELGTLVWGTSKRIIPINDWAGISTRQHDSGSGEINPGEGKNGTT